MPGRRAPQQLPSSRGRSPRDTPDSMSFFDIPPPPQPPPRVESRLTDRRATGGDGGDLASSSRRSSFALPPPRAAEQTAPARKEEPSTLENGSAAGKLPERQRPSEAPPVPWGRDAGDAADSDEDFGPRASSSEEEEKTFNASKGRAAARTSDVLRRPSFRGAAQGSGGLGSSSQPPRLLF